MKISEKKFRALIRRVITENTHTTMEYHDKDHMDPNSDLIDDEHTDSELAGPGFILADLDAEDLDLSLIHI